MKSEAVFRDDTWQAHVLEHLVRGTRLRRCDVNPQNAYSAVTGFPAPTVHTTDWLLLGCSACECRHSPDGPWCRVEDCGASTEIGIRFRGQVSWVWALQDLESKHLNPF